MAAPNLVFSHPAYTGGPVDLLLGEGEGAVIAPPPASATLQAALPGVAFGGLAIYNNRTPLRLSAGAALRQQQAARSGFQNPVRWVPAAPGQQAWPAGWTPAAPGRDGVGAVPWVSSLPQAGQSAARHQQARALQQTAALRHQSTLPRQQQAAARYQQAQPWAAAFAARHQRAAWAGRSYALAIAAALAQQLQSIAGYQRAAEAHRQWRARWQQARPVPMGLTVYLPPPGPGTEPRTVSLHLLFACPVYQPGAPVLLRFGRTCLLPPGNVVPERVFYMVQNHVVLARMPAGTEFAATAFTLDLDADSWTFGWSASLPGSARVHLVRTFPGERIEVQALVNGQAVRLLVDSIGRDRQFPADRIGVRGRGLAADLGDVELFFGNAAPRTAQQLANDVLTVNGQPFGWSVDWQIDDWLVPGGLWLHQGSYISALQDIATAVGAYLQPHLTQRVIRVLPRYPQTPWTWSSLTPDLELPAAATTLESTEEVIKPAYNGVFVGGVSGGVFGPAVRAGTAGDVLAPQVAHPLITQAEAHLQRGRAVLSDTGLQEHLTLKTLLLPEMGIVMPGSLVRFVNEGGARLGLVRKTSISMNNWPTMHQTLGVETHVE